VANPFDELEPAERKRLFPNKVLAKAPPFTREQLRALYDLLPAHAYRPVRFAPHSGMRWWSELQRMVWGRVDFARRVYTVDPRWAKRGKEREVPLGDVALEILRQIRPANPRPEDPVWLNSRGKPMHDIRPVFEARVKKVCPAPAPGRRLPDLHSLRRTCATALDRVAPRSIVRAILGHGPQEVTDLYIEVTLEDQLAALNRAALLIDGEALENVVPLAAPEAIMAVRMGVSA
jgi:integrase